MTTAQLDLLHVPSIRDFEDVVAAVMGQGRGMTLRQLGTADALGRELAKDTPDPERLTWLARRLGLDPLDMEVTHGCS